MKLLLLIFGAAAFVVVAMAKEQKIKVSGRVCCMVSEEMFPPIEEDDQREHFPEQQYHQQHHQQEQQQQLEFPPQKLDQRREKRDIRKICVSPKHANVDLLDHWTFATDSTLMNHELKDTTDYSFEWSEDKFFGVKPFLKVQVECRDGRTLSQTFEHYDETIIVQNINV